MPYPDGNPDPEALRAQAEADGAAAQSQEATRDETGWALHVSTMTANIDNSRAHTALAAAEATAWEGRAAVQRAIASLIRTVRGAIILAVVVAIVILAGWA